ncbi:protein OS-9-like isoform X2 [Biomphalaria glabrata]|uniref:Protein OS-9-like isoform X2 n=1 Tax=Biomphalaria glabrata TaxID=6526 RepID=A0A9W2Y9X3_BIOGL|nr:protein OS-9-like isoform X2 [Biomphalaria glabrata]
MASFLVISPKMVLVLMLLLHNAYSFMDMEELKSVYYGLDILSEPIVVNTYAPLGSVYVTSKYGQQYQCSFPDHSTIDKQKEEEEKIAIETGIIEMLKPMGLKDCLFKTKDWWSYEFCYGKYIRQFHMEDGEIKGNIIYLGYYESDFDWNNETAREDRLKSKVNMNKYHSQVYTLGTKCDLTNQMRRAEVRFLCEENSEDYLYRIDESETCVYTVIVMTSKICRHPYLKAPVKRQPVPITCNPLLTQSQYQEFLADKEEEQRKINEKALELQRARESKAQSSDELFIPSNAKLMSKEAFQDLFGYDEDMWELYLKGTALAHRQHNLRIHKEIKQQQNADAGIDKEADDTNDEDEEILSKFDEEIKEIKKKFELSRSKLASLKKKITQDKNWESEIESAIKEAEGELGVKVDRSLISGLSNTLDKLFNKLQDTEAELSDMNKEIGKLQPSSTSTEQEADGEKEEEEKNESHEKIVNKSQLDEPVSEEDKLEEPDNKVEGSSSDVETLEDDADGTSSGLDDKVLAPPKTLSKNFGTRDSNRLQSNPPGVEGKPPNEAEVKAPGTESSTDALQKGDKDDEVNLPQNVKKVLEDNLMKEYQRYSLEQDSTKPLKYHTDHSFAKNKMYHVIQQEDEDGKTNRFIFVFGLNNFNEELSEQERQSSLEENYSYVYKEKKNKHSKNPQS